MLFKNWLGSVVLTGFTVVAADDSNILSQEFARTSNQSLLWGSYRPNVYFGVRPRIPNSLMGGLMWSKVESYQDVQNSRWPCLPQPLKLGTFANWVRRF
jgi:mannosyl-oligosaccharide glucosidase